MAGLLQNNRGAGGIALMVVALLSLALAPPGCTEEPGDPCLGGVVRNGVCEPKCDPSKCLADNVCVDNQCRLQCSSHDDCFFGVQECMPAQTDETAVSVQVCLSNGRQPALTDGYPIGGYGFGCPFGEDQCTASACPNGLECDPLACADCELDVAACGDNTQCNIGRCASSGEVCTFNTCSAAECKKMSCITSGEGDADAYCTANDCAADADCPGGYYCGVTRDPRTVCGRTCDNGSCSHDGSPCVTAAQCEKGFGLCGETLDPCLQEAELSANGASYFDGSLCVLRRTCLLAEECASCTENLDCSRGTADVCVANNGENVCARFCNADPDCTNDKSCQPYGSTCQNVPTKDCTSSADCPDEGACVPRNVCLPKSGACKAMPSGNNFCHHCVDDTDCGGPGSSLLCVQVNDAEKACFDYSFPVSCTNDSDCPMSPGGANGECLDEAEGVSPGSSVYQHCYFPFDNASSSFTCFP